MRVISFQILRFLTTKNSRVHANKIQNTKLFGFQFSPQVKPCPDGFLLMILSFDNARLLWSQKVPNIDAWMFLGFPSLITEIYGIISAESSII